MNKLELIQTLTGPVVEQEIQSFDCYIRPNLGMFIPLFPNVEEGKHPAYEIIIYFNNEAEKSKHYWAEIISPNILHEKIREPITIAC